MEMDRRSIDRSREPGLKKPRLADDVERDRPTSNGVRPRAPPTASGGASSLASRPQQSQQQQTPQNHQELVSQYKTALAELTFNSKPIITNLTIIAGENLHTAKWIAAAVCANIIEVPSDQKLPSLYLLDSIVKNIGRDYIKHFAGRLPEVFCKAYRQVDSSVHPGMRHLFGTWKGVFPPACLQMIEKELGISPPVNGASSAATTTKSESQSQRPPHSIHVNPKYLEARHRLQQPNKAKGSNAGTAAMVSPPEGVERPERSAATGGERTWADLPIKIHNFKNHQREVSSEPVAEKNSSGYDDYEYSSDHSRNSDLGHGRVVERVTERDKRDKPWYGVQKKAVETVVAQRNAFDSQHEISNYRASRPALPASVQPTGSTQKSASGGRGTNKNWKNSEEEEYMWDDINSRLTNRRGVDSSRKDVWTPDDAEKLEFDDHLHQPSVELDIGSRVDREGSIDLLRGTAFEHLDPSMWPLRQDTPTRDDGLKDTGITSRVLAQPEGPSASVGNSLASTRNNSMARTGLQLTGLLSSSGTLGQQRHLHLRPTSPSRQSSFPLRPHSPSSSAFCQNPENMLEEDHLHIRSNPHFGPKTSHYVPQLTRSPQNNQNSFPIIPQNPVQSSQHSQTSSLNHFTQRRHHNPFPLHSLPELPPVQKPGLKTEAPSAKGHPSSGHITDSSDVQGQSSASSLLAAIVQSGFLSNNSVSAGFPNLNFQDSGALALLSHNHPPLPSGPPPTQLAASSAPIGTSASVLEPASRASTFSHTASSERKPPIPPLPPGPPPSSVVGTSQTSNVASGGPNQLSGLLSSLVAKGLISTPPKELPSIHSSQVTSHLKNQSLDTTNSSIPVSSYSTPSAILKPSSGNEPPLLESAAKSISALSVPAARSEGTDLIGLQFKPEIIRRSHPLVISALFDDLPYQCDRCGFRLKLKEQLDQHLEWHVSKKHETSSRVSRKWFTSSSDWLAGNVISSSRSVSSAGRLVEAAEQKEPVVPADESQCVCLLCGELFEDFYSLERNEWMYKGAVYLPIPATGGSDLLATVDGSSQGPIVHANCISPSSIYDMGLAVDVKQGTV